MKILVISDSHGNIVNLKHVMVIAKKIGVGAIIHAGDWDTPESIEAVISTGISLFTVLGNADIKPEIGERLKVKSKRFDEKYLVVELAGRKIGITHKPSDNKVFFQDNKLDLIINGHLHSRDESIKDGVKIIRPGATLTGMNFAIYDTETNKIEFIDEQSLASE